MLIRGPSNPDAGLFRHQRDHRIPIHREVLLEHLVDVLPVDRVDALLAEAEDRNRALRTLAWLYKVGLVRVEPGARG